MLLAITDSHHGFLKGLIRYAQEHNWHVVADMIYTAQIPAGWHGDGIVSYVGYRDDLAEFVDSSGLPAVDIASLRRGWQVPKVSGDNRQLGQMAANYFLERHYRHFAWAPFINTEAATERHESFAGRLAQSGYSCHQLPSLAALEEDAHQRTWSQRQGELIRILQRLPKPLAVFAFNDCVGVEIIHACEEAGLGVPEAVAVLGVDNDPLFCESGSVHLSSICHDLEGMAYQAAAVLDRLMSGEKVPASTMVPPRGLITRRSTDILAVNHLQVARALRFIAENYPDPQLDVNRIAKATSVSRRMLERVFRSHLRRSVNEEVVRVRILKAHELVAGSTGMTILEVAMAAGFANLSHFYRTYKKHFGSTPRNDRAERRSGVESDARR